MDIYDAIIKIIENPDINSVGKAHYIIKLLKGQLQECEFVYLFGTKDKITL